MNPLNQYPLARLLFPYLFGILFSPFFFNNIFNFAFFLYTPLILLIIWMFFGQKYHSYRLRWLYGFLFNWLLFGLGLGAVFFNTPTNSKLHYSHLAKNSTFIITINDQFTTTNKTFKTVGEISAVYDIEDSIWKKANGKVLLYFQKQDEFPLVYGNKIISSAKLTPIPPAKNPNNFDYRSYLKNKGIYGQSFLKQDSWKLLSSSSPIDLKYISLQLRKRILNILEGQNFDTESQALVAAILIGYDEYLSDDLRARFAGSGAMHILCVSGLHVGVIYMLFNFLLSFLKRNRFEEMLKIIFILSIIWIYALITGLSPSVMRASIMFSFIILGGFYNRNRNAYNSLAGSALLLLLFDPFLIYNVGFQLSYSAVFGLFFIYPKLKQMITIRNSISNKIWELMCISIAAQLSTSPLAIYYFHQFPNYFILTNLFVIPLAFSIVILGMLVLAISFFSLSTNFISQLLMLSLNILNKGVLQVSLLPYAVSDNLSLKRLELPMFYLILFSTIMLLLYKKRKWIFPLFTSVLIYLIFTISQYNSELKNNNWIVYNAKNWSVMDFISQRKSVLYGDSLFINSPDLQRYIIDENHIMNRIIQTTIIKNNYTKESAILEDLAFQGNLILFQSLRILYLDNEFRNNHYDKKLAIDFVVVSHNANIDLKTLKESYFFKMIILDSSNDWNTTNKLMQEAKKQGIDCWNVNEKGAFVWEIKKPVKFL